MPTYRFLQLDVFTDHAFSGNPLAVFPEANGLSDEVMLKIAREMNLSETVFVLESEKPEVLRRLRIFTPTREIPFAGHPVIGTWNALSREGVRSEEHTSELQSRLHLVCRLLLEKKKNN